MSLFVVLDNDQQMYRFAGAAPEVIMDEVERYYPEIATMKLLVNYRSTSSIIEVCRRLIAHNYSDLGGPYGQRFFKEITPRPDAPEGLPPTFQIYDDADAEAKALAEAIVEQLVTREPGDLFVGARTRAQLGYLEGPLVRAKIPFINIAGGSFWASGHVAAVIAYLRLAVNERDKEAFKRVYNIASIHNVHPWGERRGEYCSHRYLGKAFLQACGDSYTNVWSAANQKNSFRPGVEDLTSLVREVKATLGTQGHVAALQFILDECYVRYLQAEEGLESTDESENGKLEDLQTVMDVAGQFENAEQFLGHVDEMVKAAEAAKDKNWADYVVISTVHRLKGQERPVVFGVGLAQGLLPHRFAFEAPPQLGKLPTGDKARLEDERDICYVLVSRAMEEVHLSAPERYRGKPLAVSQFVVEMGLVTDVIEEAEAIVAQAFEEATK